MEKLEHNPEQDKYSFLPLLIALTDGRYESLRRQLNAYGFRKVSAEKSWSRQDDIFHRDRPQDLVNVRPRRRESKPRLSRSQKAIKAKLLAKSSKPTPATSFPGRKNVGSQSSSCQKKSSVSIERMSSSSYGRPKSPIPSEESITQASECIHARGVEASEEEYIGKESSKGSLLEFPEMLHRFIEDCSATHPDVAVWNSTHTAFNVEMHHPLLRGLLLRYFRRTSRSLVFIRSFNPYCQISHSLTMFLLEPTDGNYSSLRRQLNLYGFQRNS